jgi:amino acid transporter
MFTTQDEDMPLTPPALDQKIGFQTLLFLCLSSTIGSGWLFASLYAAEIAGPAAIVSWVLGGAFSFLLALVYAELGAMLPISGSVARIPHYSHGFSTSFMVGWIYWLVCVAVAPVEVTALLEYSATFVPWLSKVEAGQQLLTPYGVAIAAVLLLFFTVINLMGVRWLSRATVVLTWWKLVVPILAAVVLLLAGNTMENFTQFGGFAPNGLSGIFGAVSSGGVLFSLLGFRAAMDFAGECENPQRNIPLAMGLGVISCVAIYALLQVAFVGVIPAAYLSNGWNGISDNFQGGPYAVFALMLGLNWLATLLYVDAVVSPSGTSITYVGAASRINYAMSQNGHLPGLFSRLNAVNIPINSLIVNYFVGLFFLVPDPDWQKITRFITAALVLSLAVGPVSLAALRLQAPELQRPFRLPGGILTAGVAFYLSSLAIYWAGWESVSSILLCTLAGVAVFGFIAWTKHDDFQAQIRHFVWIPVYLIGMGVISYLGQFGNGKELIPNGVDNGLILLVSALVFYIAIQVRLPDAQVAESFRKNDGY